MNKIEEILLQQRGSLLGFIQARVFDEDLAEDILQEGLLKALESSSEVRDEEKLIPWFYQILRNAIIDTYRKKDVESRYQESYARQINLEFGPEEEAELCACLRDLLPGLKPEYADLIDRLELKAGDTSVIATQLGISMSNLKVRRHRARQAIKQRLEETCRTCAVHGCLDCTCEANRRPAKLVG